MRSNLRLLSLLSSSLRPSLGLFHGFCPFCRSGTTSSWSTAEHSCLWNMPSPVLQILHWWLQKGLSTDKVGAPRLISGVSLIPMLRMLVAYELIMGTTLTIVGKQFICSRCYHQSCDEGYSVTHMLWFMCITNFNDIDSLDITPWSLKLLPLFHVLYVRESYRFRGLYSYWV